MEKDPIIISGYIAKYNTKFIDGRTIEKGAFDHQDGSHVPVTLNISGFSSLDNQVIGYAVLESREDGMYATAYIDNTEENQEFLQKQFTKFSDKGCMLGIFANQLHESNRVVKNGTIRSMSIVEKCDSAASIDDAKNFEGVVE